MKNRRERAKQVRRRRIANLAAYSKKYTVNNCTIPQPDKENIIEEKVAWGTIEVVKGDATWKNPKDGYPQPKRLKKAFKKKYYNKDRTIRKIVTRKSDFGDFPDHTFHPKTKEERMEQMVQHKIAKWEKKNPCPVKPNQNPPDMFEKEFVEPWKAKREIALERIRDFVVSMYDKLPLTGRFKQSENKFVEKEVAKIKDVNMEGHRVNELDPKKSKLLKVAQKKTNEVKKKHSSLVCTNLRDHKRQKGRLIMPKAA